MDINQSLVTTKVKLTAKDALALASVPSEKVVSF